MYCDAIIILIIIYLSAKINEENEVDEYEEE